jgi:hypothetical protein
MTADTKALESACLKHHGFLKAIIVSRIEIVKWKTVEALREFDQLVSKEKESLFVEDINDERGLECQFKGIKLMLSLLSRKKRNTKTGERTTKPILDLLHLKTAKKSKTSDTVSAKSSTTEDKIKKAFDFGPLPQNVEVSSSSEEVDDNFTEIVSLSSQEENIENDPPNDSTVYTDLFKKKLVKMNADGSEEIAEMFEKAGSCFWWGRFATGEEVESEIPLLILPIEQTSSKKEKVQKKPATVRIMKKPSAASSATFEKRKLPGTAHVKVPEDCLVLRPNGCSKCRQIPGCTRACWKQRGY